MKKIPVILDTDIGSDIDDTWALIMLLKSPELEIKLITTASDDTEKRAQLVAKILETAGRTDIPIGIGIKKNSRNFKQYAWASNYPLEQYKGQILKDGVQAIVDCILESPTQITIIAIGPLTNIAAVLKINKDITKNSRFVGMQGSIYKGYDGASIPHPEYNVIKDIKAARTVFRTQWDKLITPLDTCGLVRLRGENYSKLLESKDKLVQLIIENYKIWAGDRNQKQTQIESSRLFDTVAIYLVYAEDLVNIERLPIDVNWIGKTYVKKKKDDERLMVSCAISWKSLSEFEDHLVSRLISHNQLPHE